MYRRPMFVAAVLAGAVTGSFATVAWVQGQTAPPAVRTEPLSFRGVVKAVLPAVVSIDSKASPNANRRRTGRPAEDEQVPDSFRKFFEDLEKRESSSPQREQTIGFGSGFIIDTKGVILTNNHVIAGADTVEVTLGDGRKFTSKDIKGDQRTDLAIIRIDPKGARLPAIELGDSSEMEIGDRVLAIGAPFGLSGSVTQGIVSAKGRDLGLNNYDDFLQTDAAINPGNSGGPLVNLDGKVVGINSAIKSRSGGFQGVGMAISSNMARSVVQQLVRDGTVKRPYLGIEAMTDLQPQAATQYGLSDGGVVIARVRENGPAAKGGLRAEDAIVSLNGKAVHDLRELQRLIAAQPIGTSVELGLLRDAKPLTIRVTLEEEPKDYLRRAGGEPTPRRRSGQDDGLGVERVGLELADVTADQAQRQGLPAKAGVVISAVERGSVAEAAGLTPGMLVLKVNRKPVDTAAAAKRLIEGGLADQGALVLVQSGEAVSAKFLQVK